MSSTVKFQTEQLDLWQRCGVFLINLDRSPERLVEARRNFMAANIPFERISGVDASKEDISSYLIDRAAFTRIHGRSVPRKSEIGCYQSHLRAIRAFVDSGKEFGIILEDDAKPEPHLLSGVEQLLEWYQAWDIVPLFHFHSGGPVILRDGGSVSLVTYLAHVSSAAAYLINRSAAEVLLQHLAVQRACVDHALFDAWSHGLKLRGVTPMAIGLTSQAHVSTINAESTDKLSLLHRTPTLLLRLLTALRIACYGLSVILRHSFSKNKSGATVRSSPTQPHTPSQSPQLPAPPKT